MRVERLECRRGGSFRFVQQGDDGAGHAFHGVFHTVRGNEFILMTFEYEGHLDVVSLEYARLEELRGQQPGPRSRGPEQLRRDRASAAQPDGRQPRA